MSEGDPGPSDSDGGGGSFWTSLPALLTAAAVLIGAVVSAVATLRDNDDEAVASATTTAPTTTDGEPQTLIAPFERPDGRRLYYEGGTMYVRAPTANRPVVAVAEANEAFGDVSLRARIARTSGAPDFGAGFVCRHVDDGNYYLLSVLSGGRYHLVRYRRGKPVSLTGGIRTSDAIEDGEQDVAARCVGDDPVILTLSVGGTRIATARDEDGIESGNVGVRVGTGESAVTVSFVDLRLDALR